jgi:flagellar hook-associated protein 3 FlgL
MANPANAATAAATIAFSVSLDTSTDAANDGTGLVGQRTVALTGGKSLALTGVDVNPQETNSVFNALLRLEDALQSNDNAQAQRAMGLLDQTAQQVTYCQAGVGAQEQSLSLMQTRLSSEEVDLKSAMSSDYDTDMAQVISDLTARQISFQASLQTAGSILKMTLLNYL